MLILCQFSCYWYLINYHLTCEVAYGEFCVFGLFGIFYVQILPQLKKSSYNSLECSGTLLKSAVLVQVALDFMMYHTTIFVVWQSCDSITNLQNIYYLTSDKIYDHPLDVLRQLAAS